MKPFNRSAFSLAFIASLFLASCGGSDSGSSAVEQPTDPETDPSESSFVDVLLDSNDSTAYLNLATGEVVEVDDVWHIGVNRLNVTLNTNVEAAVGDFQDSFYDDSGSPDVSVFTNATADSELNALFALTSGDDLIFEADTLSYAITDWYNYNFQTHVVTPNAESNWIILSAEENSYAKMTVADIVQNGQEFTTTFDFDIQAEGEAGFSGTTSSSFVVSNQDEKTCFDFDSGASVDCAGSTWDIAMDAGVLLLNGGDSVYVTGNAKATGPISSEDLSSYVAGTDIPLVAYTTDVMAGVFSESTWYAYNLLERHGIWPNYRVYIVDTEADSTDDQLIKVQLINYYDAEGTSGNVTVRFLPLSISE